MVKHLLKRSRLRIEDAWVNSERFEKTVVWGASAKPPQTYGAEDACPDVHHSSPTGPPVSLPRGAGPKTVPQLLHSGSSPACQRDASGWPDATALP